MNMKRRTNFRNDERGSAILIALFALLLVSAIGFGMMYSSSTETNVNANFRDSQRAYLAARAGLEEVRQRMAQDSFGVPLSANPITPPAGMPSSTSTNILYVKNPTGTEAVDPTDTTSNYWDDELCQDGFTGLSPWTVTPVAGMPCDKKDAPNAAWLAPSVNSVLPGMGAADALSYKWVRVTTKANLSAGSAYPVDSSQTSTNPGGPVCWTGTTEVVIPSGSTCAAQPTVMNPVYVLTALGVGPQGSKRMAQMEVSVDPPLVTNGTVDSQAGVTLQGKLGINSYDNCNCDLTKSPPTDLNGHHCDNTKWAVFSQGNIGVNGNANSIVSGITTGTPAGTQANVPNSQWPYNIPQLINKYKNMNAVTPAGVCSGGSCSAQGATWGANSTDFTANGPLPNNMQPQVTYLPGNARLTGNVMGSGVLVVDGNLDIHGGFQWYGLVLVKGTIDFTGGGSDPVNLYGAFLNGSNVNAVNIFDVLGGSVVLQYDSCALKSLNNKRPPIVLASRELMY